VLKQGINIKQIVLSTYSF